MESVRYTIIVAAEETTYEHRFTIATVMKK